MGFALSNMQLTSTAFDQGGSIPSQYTGEGEDISPPLNWSDAPEDAQAFAVICHDPDAPLITPQGTYGFVHWALYNIPASITHLAEATSQHTQGQSDFGKPGYGGPMPPNGHGLHQYYFWILALDNNQEIEAGLTLWQLLERIEPSVI
ncbi:MAG: YbhB/YbcL family Raf kinase inhibitor-like protein, partial [Gammaproteobacteria bacterium]|nr:YbhB/YbcL family Raf kinase inhibitor-like protein [Gammaproteobacteria bacterium]